MKRHDTTSRLANRWLRSGTAFAVLTVFAGCSSSGGDGPAAPADDGGLATMPGDTLATPGTAPGDEDTGVDTGAGTGVDTGTGTGTGDVGPTAPPVIEPPGSAIAPDADTLLTFLVNPETGVGAEGDVVVQDGPGSDSFDTFDAWRCRTDSGIVEYVFEPSAADDPTQTTPSNNGLRYDETSDAWARFNIDAVENDSLMFSVAIGVREQDQASVEGGTTGELTTVRTGPGRAWSGFDSLAQSALACTESEVTRAQFQARADTGTPAKR